MYQRISKVSIVIATFLLCHCGFAYAQSSLETTQIQIAQTNAAEIEFWQTVKSSDDPAELKAYLQIYPDGKFSVLARIRLKRLTSEDDAAKNAYDDGVTENSLNQNQLPVVKQTKSIPVKISAVKNDPKRAEAGFKILENIPEIAELLPPTIARQSVLILELEEGGGAEKAGITVGSIILSVEDKPATSINAVRNAIKEYSIGDTVTVNILELAQSKSVLLSMFQERANLRKDNGVSKYLYARMLDLGVTGVTNREKAFVLFKLAADDGNVTAMARLGEDLFFGRPGVEKDAQRAFKWFSKAADSGSVYSMSALGHMYKIGDGVAKDPTASFSWYKKSADLGNAYAMYATAILYDEGKGTARNNRLAAKYLLDSYHRGNKSGTTALLEKPLDWSNGTRREIQKLLKEAGVY
ncbi:MAG: hypothetical protein ACR2O3_18130, partial [Rhizobiaceae bacterium]